MTAVLRYAFQAHFVLAAYVTAIAVTGGSDAAAADNPTPKLFDVRATDVPDAQVPHIRPWKTIQLDPEYRGAWIVAGDLDGDGQAEIISVRNHNQNDTHYTSSIVVHRLDGSVMWRWGSADAGRNKLHHDVAAQVYDWDGDGNNEVIVAADQAVIELDGRTGREKRKFSIPANASDCIVFCNVSGGDRATDILVKTRYTQIWAFDRNGKQLWTVDRPGGNLTAHQPRPIDIDGDGTDEIMAGFALLNADGSLRWRLTITPRPGNQASRWRLDISTVHASSHAVRLHRRRYWR